MRNSSGDQLRECLSFYPTGVAIATAYDDKSEPVGLTINSLASLSLDPPLVCWSIHIASRLADTFREGRFCGLHLLCDQQRDLALRFSARGSDHRVDVDCGAEEHAVPVIDLSLGFIEARISKRYAEGDHYLLICEVLHMRVHGERKPLLFVQRSMMSLGVDC